MVWIGSPGPMRTMRFWRFIADDVERQRVVAVGDGAVEQWPGQLARLSHRRPGDGLETDRPGIKTECGGVDRRPIARHAGAGIDGALIDRRDRPAVDKELDRDAIAQRVGIDADLGWAGDVAPGDGVPAGERRRLGPGFGGDEIGWKHTLGPSFESGDALLEVRIGRGVAGHRGREAARRSEQNGNRRSAGCEGISCQGVWFCHDDRGRGGHTTRYTQRR